MVKKSLAFTAILAGAVSLLAPAPAALAASSDDDCQHVIRTGDVPTDAKGYSSVAFESDCLAIPNRAYVRIYSGYINPGSALQVRLETPDGDVLQLRTIKQHNTVYAVTGDMSHLDWLMGEWRVGVQDSYTREENDWNQLSWVMIQIDLDY